MIVVLSLIVQESAVVDLPNSVNCKTFSLPIDLFQSGKVKQAFHWLQAAIVQHLVEKNLPVLKQFLHIPIITDVVFDTSISFGR
jgi:hypothetical protein